MMGKLRFATCASVLGLSASLFTAGSALASGFALREESAEGLGNAFAGQTAKAYNASTVYYNPAGMSNLTQDEVAGTLTWIAPVAKFTGSNSNVLGGNVAGVQTKDAIKDAAVGTVFGVYKLNPDWTLGLSVAAPYGMRSDYKADWVGRYQALHSDITDIEFSPVLSYKVNEKWSVGGGPRIDYLDATLSQSVNSKGLVYSATRGAVLAGGGGAAAAAAAGATASAGVGDGSAKVWGDDTGLGYVLSTLYKFDEQTRAGVSYRSRVDHKLSGSVGYNLPGVSATIANGAKLISQDANAKITTPDSLNIGLYHEINDQWAVMSDLSWTNWSLLKSLTIKGADTNTVSNTWENWHDTYFISVGANYKPSDKWVLHTGFAFDQSPVPDANRTARIPDSNRYWLSFGTSYDVMPGMGLNFGYSHLFADKASIAETANALSGTLTGNYDNSANIVSASFTMQF